MTITKKIIRFIKNEYPILIIITVIFTNYNNIEKLVYLVDIESIDLKVMLLNFLRNLTLFIMYIFEIINKLIHLLLTKDILKIILIGYFINKTLSQTDIPKGVKQFIDNIKEFSYKDLIIKLTEEKSRKIEEIELKKESGDIDDTEADEKIVKVIEESEIIALILDNHVIRDYLNNFINLSVKEIKIPINLIGRTIKLYEIQKLFIFETETNCIKIIGLNDKYEETIINVFNNLNTEGYI